jgi:hypothetical protein
MKLPSEMVLSLRVCDLAYQEKDDDKIKCFGEWLRHLGEYSPFRRAIRSDRGSRNGKKQTPHPGPGRPKGWRKAK